MVVFSKLNDRRFLYTWSMALCENRLIFSSRHVNSVWMVPGTFSVEN